jgi:hypothetical protein
MIKASYIAIVSKFTSCENQGVTRDFPPTLSFSLLLAQPLPRGLITATTLPSPREARVAHDIMFRTTLHNSTYV